MARPVTWNPSALRDLQETAQYIARDSTSAAEHTVQAVLRKADRVGTFPHAGRRVPEIGRADVRQVLWRSYRIIYWVRASEIRILAVVHGARRLEDLLDDLLK